MTRNRKRVLIAGLIIIKVAVIVSLVTQSFSRDHNAGLREMIREMPYQVVSFALPDEFYFAGERMPLENFDTRESLDREILISAYRHSATITLIKRANRFFPVIEPILSEYGIPDDFKYLAVAESDLSNLVSPVGATGFWQIMEATGKEYGMEINDEVDERYDLVKSTHFACRYLLKSYEKYGSWTLAAASYNAGNRGIDEQISIQKENSYYDLLLNEETARYIFRVASYKLIFTEPGKYGIVISKEDLYPPIPSAPVTVNTAVPSFEEFAKQHGTNYKIIKFLNPWLRKPFLTNSRARTYSIMVPEPGARGVRLESGDQEQ
ncbi:MAG: lytic transglycosylase domain-containing protein [Bacteroidetes bacterium]|nr:lytic transglycosylase domain-containing protein [Bacteroidota bacterium]